VLPKDSAYEACEIGDDSVTTQDQSQQQQDQAFRLPNFFTHHHITNLDLAKMKLGQQDQAIRLSHALGKPPLGIAVGKP
jgi:hypothetical protein